jgi:mono/diheme cytochrome c family protein
MEKTDDQLKASIIKGVNNPDNPAGMSMLPYGGGPALTDKQISDVISYIRTLKK